MKGFDISLLYQNTIKKVREISPLIHHITNYVTINDCANITLAFGASPVMANCIDEVEEIVSISSALVLNIGTIQKSKIESYLIAGKIAKKLGKPIIFDPVGCGVSKLRSDVSEMIIEEVKPDVIRGNMAEIKYLLCNQSNMKGVDSKESMENAKEVAKELALKTKSVIVTTGKQDYITDGIRLAVVSNGNFMLSKITGAGCMLNSIIASCCGVEQDFFVSSTIATLAMGICGETAEKGLNKNEGSGTFRQRLIDAFYYINDEKINEYGRMKIE